MSKIGNLFKNFRKKKKKSEDLDEIFSDDFEDIPEQEVEEFDDSQISREEVVLKDETSEEASDETRAEFTNELMSRQSYEEEAHLDEMVDETILMDPPTDERTKIQPRPAETREIDISGLELESEPGEAHGLNNDDDEILDEFTDVEINPNLSLETRSQFEIDRNEPSDQDEDYSDDDEEDYEDEEDYQEEGEFDYTMDTGSHLQAEIDLENDKITLKDRFDQWWTIFFDRFRNMGKKDLNQAMKPPGKEKTKSRINVAALDKAVTRVKKVEWNSLVDRILKNKERPQIHRYYQYVFTFLMVYIVSNIIGNLLFSSKPDYAATVVAPVVINEEYMVTQNHLNDIRKAKVFKTVQPEVVQTQEKKVDVFTKCTKASQKSSLPIKLFHTVVLQDSVKSIASVSVRSDAKVTTVREGDKISSLANLDRIERLKLIVKNLQSGDCEYIASSLEKESTRKPPQLGVLTPKASREYRQQLKKIDGIENDGNNFKIKKDFLQEKVKDLSTLLTQARGIPINNPDGTMSFKIVQIQPDSVYSHLGIQEGDIITSINGEAIENVGAVMNLFKNIATIDKLNLTIQRGGEPVSQNYNIK